MTPALHLLTSDAPEVAFTLRHFLRNASAACAYVPFTFGTNHGLRLPETGDHERILQDLLSRGYALILETLPGTHGVAPLTLIHPPQDFGKLQSILESTPEILCECLKDQLDLVRVPTYAKSN